MDSLDSLDSKVMAVAREELLSERLMNSGNKKQLEKFMKKYGYRASCGWWREIGKAYLENVG